MWSSLNDAMPTECPLPPTSKIAETICSNVSKSRPLKIASTGDSFSLEKRCAFPILSSGTMMNDRAGRQVESGLAPQARSAARATVSMRAAALGVPHHGFELLLLVGVDEIATFLLKEREEPVVDRARRRGGCRPMSIPTHGSASC